MVQRHYKQLEANVSGQVIGTVPPSSLTEIDYFTYFESPPLTPVNGHAGTLQWAPIPSDLCQSRQCSVHPNPRPSTSCSKYPYQVRYSTMHSSNQPQPTVHCNNHLIPAMWHTNHPKPVQHHLQYHQPTNPQPQKEALHVVVGRHTGIYWYDSYLSLLVLI